MATLGRAISITSKAFEEVLDKQRQPYILHCLHVMNGVSLLGEAFMIVGVLHDLVEDTDWTLSRLLEEGFSREVVEAVDAVSRRDLEPYTDFIKRCSSNVIGREVKKADLRHNTLLSRSTGLTPRDLARQEKYMRAYAYLLCAD